MKKRTISLLLFVVLLQTISYSQQNISKQSTIINKRGWEVSGNFGVYQANGFHANYYSGDERNINNIDYVLDNQYWFQGIKDILYDNVRRDSIIGVYHPRKMSYQPALNIGFSGRFHFSNQLAFNVHVNTMQLFTNDIISFKVDPPLAGMVESFVNATLYGRETRTNIDFGLMYSFEPKDNFNFFVEMGTNINSTRVRESAFILFETTFNLIDIYGSVPYIPNAPMMEYPVFQGGIGFGLFASGGLRYTINSQACIEIAPNIYFNTINLQNYNRRLMPHFSTQFRIVVSPLFQFSKN